VAHASPTFLERYEVPSGGDWSVHRGASVVLESAENITLRRLTYDQPGGNGLLLSKHVADCTIESSLFFDAGESAIISMGRTDLFDGRRAGHSEYPTRNTIRSNLVDGVGVYGKQSAAYFASKSHGVVMENNAFLNGPRSAININDGFMGGDTFRQNLLVAWVKESADHGPINTWDRDPTLATDERSNATLINPLPRTIAQNLIFSQCFWNCGMNGENSGGGHCIDHDDGSSAYNDVDNVLVYGAVKTRDGVNRTVAGNLMLWGDSHRVGLLGPQCGGQNTTRVYNNTAIASSGQFYACVRSPSELDFPRIHSNHFFVKPLANGSLPFGALCPPFAVGSLQAWQSNLPGLDAGSTIESGNPPHMTTVGIISQARSILGLVPL